MLQQCASRSAISGLQALAPCVQHCSWFWLNSSAAGTLQEGVVAVASSVVASDGSCSSQQQQQQQQQQAGVQHRQECTGLHDLQRQQQQQQPSALPLLDSFPQLLQQPTQSHPFAWPGSSRAFSSSSSSSAAAQQRPLKCIPAAAAAAAAAAGWSVLLPATSWQLGQQLQQQRGIRQMLPFDSAPKPLPRFRKPSKDGRMNRMVIRIPPQVQVQLQDQAITLTGKEGSTSLKLSFLDPTGLVAWQAHTHDAAAAAAAAPGSGSLLLLASPSKRCWRGIQTHIDNAVHGVMQGYLVGITVQGVGYRMEPVSAATTAAALAARGGSSSSSKASRRIIWEQEAEKTNIAYPHKQPAQAVRLKVGYTRACIFQLPEGVLAFFVKPALMYLYGVDKALVTNTAAAIRAVRKPNAYTGNGIQLVGEVLKLKQRAGSK
uniref:Ribosomal protein L6 alpha-beta domain-containing protein n=1 Tax=Tetradesmus obliquus TaxID=3088 RepID=A0A383WGD5_TETOB|eukprot:jgi/Sobl393_1/9606/SZX76578.1